MTAESRRSHVSGAERTATARGADRNSSSTEGGIEITLNTFPDVALDWLKENVFWNQFGRKSRDGYGKLLKLRKSETHLASWNTVLAWLKSSACLDGLAEGYMNCETARCHLKLFAQIHDEEIVFLLSDCLPKVRPPKVRIPNG